MKKGIKVGLHTKLPYELIPWDTIDQVAEVFKYVYYTKAKYKPRNWEEGLPASWLFASSMRHLKDWFQYGLDKDEETGIHPLAHVMCDVMFALALSIRGKLIDDRPKTSSPKKT